MSDGYDAIGTLVRGYPSHDFVIDYIEACMLFNNVALADNIVAELVHSMGDQARVPLSVEIASPGGRGMEYLNDEEAEVKCRPQGVRRVEITRPLAEGLTRGMVLSPEQEVGYRAILRDGVGRVFIRGSVLRSGSPLEPRN